jgi:hypothetical protein
MVIDPVAIGGPRPIDQDDAHARRYVKELTWSLLGDPAIAGTEDGIALWNLAQLHQVKLNLQTVSEGLPTLKEAFTNFLGIRRFFSFPVIIQPGTKILANQLCYIFRASGLFLRKNSLLSSLS